MWLIAAVFLILFAAVEVGAFVAIPRMAKWDQEVWLQEVLKQKPSEYTKEEYFIQCLFEFVIFNAGILIGIALGWIAVRGL